MTRLTQTFTRQQRRRKGGLQLLYDLYHDDFGKLGLAFLFYTVKTSPVWLMPFLIAQVITVITTPPTV